MTVDPPSIASPSIAPPPADRQPIDLISIAQQFQHAGQVTNLYPFGSGNINDTFLVTLDPSQPTIPDLTTPDLTIPEQIIPESTRFILQRINTRVFQQPHLVMQNMRTFTEHVRDRLHQMPLDRRWETPWVIPTQTGQDYWQDAAGSCWRAISFIAGSESFNTLQTLEQAREVGYALGMFHNLISDLPPDTLADTLPGFHITPLYLQHYQQVLQPAGKRANADVSGEVKYCLQFIRDRQAWAAVLETAKATGKLPLRLMHGDPKINNVMFDRTTHKAVSMIDLDTVKPGLVHYDIGDCLRSGCNPAGEETEQWQSVHFELDLCLSILQGYSSVAIAFLTENDYTYLYDAIRLIAFELGLRFFTDYLAGNVYFKVKHAEHNLARALVQFKLTESIEAQETAIRTIIQDMR